MVFCGVVKRRSGFGDDLHGFCMVFNGVVKRLSGFGDDLHGFRMGFQWCGEKVNVASGTISIVFAWFPMVW